MLLHEPELRSTRKGGNRQTLESWVYSVSKTSNIIEPNHSPSQEKWKNPSLRLRRLPQFKRSYNHKRIPFAIYGLRSQAMKCTVS